MRLETRDALGAWLDKNHWLNNLVVEELVGVQAPSLGGDTPRIRAWTQI
jgi:hypothetical protein